jgi:hypothetical protein
MQRLFVKEYRSNLPQKTVKTRAPVISDERAQLASARPARLRRGTGSAVASGRGLPNFIRAAGSGAAAGWVVPWAFHATWA